MLAYHDLYGGLDTAAFSHAARRTPPGKEPF
jgi:hypothetical protein